MPYPSTLALGLALALGGSPPPAQPVVPAQPVAPAQPVVPAQPVAPGGYWSIAESHDRQGEPKDGEEALTIGSVLLPLGLLRGGTGAVNVWMAGQPDKCPATDDAGCNSFAIFGWYGVAEGGLMLVTGVVYLAMGAHQRAAYQRWKSGGAGRRARLNFSPYLAPPIERGGRPSGGGLRLLLQF